MTGAGPGGGKTPRGLVGYASGRDLDRVRDMVGMTRGGRPVVADMVVCVGMDGGGKDSLARRRIQWVCGLKGGQWIRLLTSHRLELREIRG